MRSRRYETHLTHLSGPRECPEGSGNEKPCGETELLRRFAEVSYHQQVENTILKTFARLFMKGARILEFDKLREVCGDYQQLNFAKGNFRSLRILCDSTQVFCLGAVELPLFCAEILDADRQGQEHWAAGCPANDPRAQFWTKRLNCYQLVLDSLSVFEDRSTNAKKQPAALSSDDPETVRGHAYELAFASEDEMFHSTLYDWLIQRGLADELLEVGRHLFSL